MAIVARGQLADHSVPRVVAALAARGFTGELVVESGSRAYRIAWAQGAIVGAQSPHPADSAAKIALTLGVLSSTQAGEVARVVSSTPGVNELEVIAQSARLPSEMLERLARRLVAARSARVMAIESGTYAVSDELPFWGNITPVDARWVLYSGIRQHFTIERTARELSSRASVVRLRSPCDLDGFGFGDAEAPVLARLRSGNLSVSPMPTDLDHQLAPAVVLALLLVGEVDEVGAPAPVAAAPVRPPSAPVAASPPPQSAPQPRPSLAPAAASAPRSPEPSAPPRAPVAPAVASTKSSIRALQSAAAPRPEMIQTLIEERLAILDGGGSHFALLDVSETAGPDEIRGKYFGLARHLHPDRLKAADIADHQKAAQRLFARINEAFAVLTDPAKRARYQEVMRAGGEDALRAKEAATEAAVRRALDAEERYRLGEMALRRQQLEVAVREFEKAVALNPEEADHHAMLGWSTYLAAANKASVVPIARGQLLRAIELNRKCDNAFLVLGRIARMEGNDAEAFKQFQHVLSLVPSHQEAATELRGIESRKKR